MYCFRYTFICTLLILSNINLLFSGLLPDNVVLISNNTYCSVKDLVIGQQVISLGSTKYNLRDRFSYISGIQVNRVCMKCASLIILESSQKNISTVLVGQDQKFCVLVDDTWVNQSCKWIDACCLEPGMFIWGYNDKKFKVREVQKIEFENGVDSYEISLNQYNTLYVVDSDGNPILTHNVIGLLGWMIIGGALIGGLTGAGFLVYKSYERKVSISTSLVMKGVVVGAVTGVLAAVITYYGVYLGAYYILPWLNKCRADFTLRYPYVNPELTMSVIREKLFLMKCPQLAGVKKLFFVGISAGVTVPATATMAYDVIDKTTEELVFETERLEGENIDFSETKVRHHAKADALNESYVGRASAVDILAEETLIDIDGNPVKDEKGKDIKIILATVSDD